MSVRRDLFFPECANYGSGFSSQYLVDKVNVEHKKEKRRTRNVDPRYSFDIDLNNATAIQLSEIVRLWHSCGGELFGFLFKDPTDFTSNISDSFLTGSTIGILDQSLGKAVAGKHEYEIHKEYAAGLYNKKRKIQFPKEDTLVVAVDGKQVYNFVYDYSNFKLVFIQSIASYPYAGNVTSGVITFDNSLNVNDLLYITGFTTASFNRAEGQRPYRIVEATSSYIRVEDYDTGGYPLDEVSANLVLTQAEPPTGSVITCGFEFYTPVRFDGEDAAEFVANNGQFDSMSSDFSSISLLEITP